MSKRMWMAGAVLAGALALAVAGTGCKAPAGAGSGGAQRQGATAAGSPEFPVTVTDDASRTVTIQAEPKRIVSLAPANTEIVFALGRGERLVGVTTWDTYPAEVKSIAKVGDFTNPNMEAIAGAKPDLVLVTGGIQAAVISQLEKIGATVLVIDPQTLDRVLERIRTVGHAVGAPDEAETVISKMEDDLARIRTKVMGLPKVTAFVEVGWNPLFTCGPGTLMDDMLTAAGGRNVVKQGGWVGYSAEQLVKDDPAVYLGTKSSIGDPEALEGRPGYGSLRAIRRGSIYPLDDDQVSRPGPRVVEGVRQMAIALHPDAFGK